MYRRKLEVGECFGEEDFRTLVPDVVRVLDTTLKLAWQRLRLRMCSASMDLAKKDCILG